MIDGHLLRYVWQLLALNVVQGSSWARKVLGLSMEPSLGGVTHVTL
jgi:hypothetical protein